MEFYNIAWGTGVWLGQLALKWALALFLFGLFCILCLVGTWIVLWSLKKLERPFESLSSFRDRLGTFRWVLAALFLAAPVYFLQYTFWGIVLHDHYLRILLAGFSGILLGWLLTKEANQLINWQGILTSFILVSGSFVLFVSLKEVTAYPFSLGWSEGNRLWDYSILFGRHLYDYPLDKPIPVLLDFGRKFVGGVPFLIPSVNIWQVRLWLALVDIVPYLVLGWAAFRLAKNNIMKWTLAGIWAFTFVHQGPIHPPLLLSAIVVALAWERPLWLAVPLIAVASYFAVISRLTWLFAPGMWAVMLELSGAVTAQNDPPGKRIWFRSAAAGLAGVLGGYAAPFWVPSLLRWIRTISESPVAVNPDVIVGRNVTMAAVNATVTTQPLLWSRLLPNATYNEGILIGLLLAVLPLIAVLIYLVRTGRWKLTTWQKLAIILPLLSFLVVGLIASVKIGGGADLHNLDMLIIGLMFVGAIAWRNGGSKWIDEIQAAPVWVKFVLVALILIPGYQPLMHMSPLVITEDRTTVAALADIHEDPLPNPLPDTLPSQPDTIKTLESIRKEVAKAAQNGDVLFMDQRQLLTFGYIKDVPLIPEYDKKVLINEALSGDARYFASFYRDLASRRFSLIVTNPVNRRLDKTEGHFSEENNAWVKWVSTPLLCYYESLDRLKRVDVELLVPRQDISTCEQGLPIQINK
ncbi:MAG: hypothetical protein JW730_21660 [Anaerolineales bacterium]|nr:hypothetical protein [Anaerolineales bacterium]